MNLIPDQIFNELHNVRFHVSNVCNHKCKYCHVFKEPVSDNARLMKFDVIKATLDFYARLNETHSNHIFKFSFYGGEPLFNWKVIKKTLSYGNRIIPDNIEWILNTNGTIITQDKAKILFNEGVDVHVSVDGPDEKTNKNRLFKSGRPVLKKVLNSLKILIQNNCKVQFDSCLTMANIDALEPLIDLASQNQVDRIYLALTDEAGMKEKDSFNAEDTADLLIKALEYAGKKKVVLGGPWKCFFPLFLPQSNAVVKHHPHLIIDTSGNLSFPSFPEFKLGNVEQIGTISETKAYQDALKRTANMTKTCKDCELESVCSGYLKGMVKYHTGTLQGYEIECELAKAVYSKYSQWLADIQTGKNTINISIIDKNILEKPLIHSRHLKIQPQGNNYKIVHGLSGFAIQASEDMLEYIDSFKQPQIPLDVLNKYHIPNITQITAKLVKNNILLELSKDEELEYIEERMSSFSKNRIDTLNCICLFPLKNNGSAKKFSQFIETLYLSLSTRIQPLRQKIIIYLCQDKNELAGFWFEPQIPLWINAFIASRRILVADIKGIKNMIGKKAQPGMSHEIMHILLGEYNVRIPIWLEEGLCEYFSKQDPNVKLLELIRQKKLLSFKELEAGTRHTLLDIDNARTQENICYHQSHSFVSFICKTFGEKEILNSLKDMSLQKDFSQVFYENTGKTLDEMEKEWLKRLLT